MVKKNSIPERWRSLTAVGQRVPGSRFIAFKVPLKGVTNQRVTQNQKFTPKDLISTIRSQNEELGLIIDLTNTERYYTTKDLPKSVQYVKLHTAGLKIPDDATIHQFKRVAYKFLAANSDNDKLIGVHCTTGINRTGYLICRYLIDVDEWRPLHALSAFAQARGHPIEGTVYIEDIVKGPPRSNVGIDLPPTTEDTRPEVNEFLPDDMTRDRRQREDPIRSLLELIPGNEFADFDARDQRPLPLMRSRSDEYRDDESDLYNQRPEFRGGRRPLGDMSDDPDFRLQYDRRDIPSNMPDQLGAPERFRRSADFNPEGRFNPGLDDRRDFPSSDPRRLMDAQDNYGPREMQRQRGIPHEQMGYDDRMRGRQSPGQDFYDYEEPSSQRVPPYGAGNMSSGEYDDMEAKRRMHSAKIEMAFRERLRRQELESMENENQRFDPREREMMTDSFQGPYNERMHPRNARTIEGPMNERMNARNTQLLGEPVNEMMHLRDRRDMEGPTQERMYPRDRRDMEGPTQERMHPRDRQDMEGPTQERMHPRAPRFMEGSANERFPQREAQGIRNAMDERMHLQNVRSMNGPMNDRIQSREAQLMEGPMNNRMYSRDTRQIEATTNERMQARGARLVDLPANERFNPRDEQAIDNSMNDRMPQRDPRVLNRPMNARSMAAEEPLNARMHPRMDRGMEGTMNEQMHSREGPMNERIPLRDPRAMEGRMNEQMYQRDVRTMHGSMNEPMHSRDPRGMEGSMNERMYSHEAEYPMNEERDFMNDTRPYEGRKMNPSEDLLRGANRFAPYPSQMKQGQPAEIGRGMARHDNRDPREMLPSQDAAGFPLRNRFN